MRELLLSAGLFTLVGGWAADGFHLIFDGRSLAGWETPDPSYWTVEDGAITGRITKEHPCTTNQYLVWTGGELADFELKIKSRLNGEGAINNGFQFRSRLLPDHDICGYQVDNNLRTPWLVRLYDEYGRHTLAMRGERTEFDGTGGRTTTRIPEAEGAAWFRLEDWHEYHLTCVGTRITLKVDGRLAAEVEDRDRRRQELQGVLALQLHSGPRTMVQFKDIELRILKEAEVIPAAVLSENAVPRARLLASAEAFWPLDTGGHGARPVLRHIPAWEKFELNVKAEERGARALDKVVLLDGAHFNAGPSMPPHGNSFTIYLRVRDPRGDWKADILSKGNGTEAGSIRLAGEDLQETPGQDLVLWVKTDQGFAKASFPVSKIEAKEWHDLVAWYDGKELGLYSDGRKLASAPLEGVLVKNEQDLLIGAGTENGKVGRFFVGEIEETAIWGRALSEAEISLISRRE